MMEILHEPVYQSMPKTLGMMVVLLLYIYIHIYIYIFVFLAGRGDAGFLSSTVLPGFLGWEPDAKRRPLPALYEPWSNLLTRELSRDSVAILLERLPGCISGAVTIAHMTYDKASGLEGA